MSASLLRGEVLKNMAKLGVTSLSSFQNSAISSILSGRNSVLLSESGSGKSLAYVLALSHLISSTPQERPSVFSESSLEILFQKPASSPKRPENRGALVLVPTQELSLQVYRYFRALAPWLNIARTNNSIPEIAGTIKHIKEDNANEDSIKQQGFHNLAISVQWNILDVLISTPKLLNDIIEHRLAVDAPGLSPRVIVIDEMDMLLE